MKTVLIVATAAALAGLLWLAGRRGQRRFARKEARDIQWRKR